MKQIKVMPILLGALLLLGSCVKEEFPGGGDTPDGKPTLMTLSLSASLMDDQSVTRAGLSEADENKFKNVRIMIFQPSGEVVTNNRIEYPTATVNPEIKVNTHSGSGRSVYIIANVVDAIDTRLRNVTTVDELNPIQLTASELQNGLSGKPLIMIGKLSDLDIRPGSNVISDPIRMEYISAKLELRVIDATPADHSVTILGWDIENEPQNSFLILDGGGWRLPTRRELMLMWVLMPELNKVNGFTPLFSSYNSATQSSVSNHYYVAMTNGAMHNTSKASGFGVRCIRDLYAVRRSTI